MTGVLHCTALVVVVVLGYIPAHQHSPAHQEIRRHQVSLASHLHSLTVVGRRRGRK